MANEYLWIIYNFIFLSLSYFFKDNKKNIIIVINLEKCPKTNWFKLKDISLNKFKQEINEMDKNRKNI